MHTKFWVGGLLLTTASFVSTGLMAQQATAPVAAQQRAMARGNAYKAADPATRAREMADRLTKQLSLDAATSTKVYEACLARDQKIDAIQTSSDDNKTKAKNLKANADAFKTTMQSILTAYQFAKFQQLKHHGRGPEKANDDEAGE